MENQIFRDINSGLDLNGPILSFTQQPQDVIGIGTTSPRSPNTWINSSNWQQRTVPAGESGWTLNYDTLMYGNDLFVTAGSEGYIATSPDSITWTLTPQINGDSNLDWHSGAFGNGRFVIVGQRVNDTTPIAASSTDGINWTLVTVPEVSPMEILTSVASDGSKFVASGNDPTHPVSSNLVTSTDGITWSSITDTRAGNNDLYWGNGVWISMRAYGSYSRSTDGTTWVDYTVPGGDAGSSPVAYGNGLWVMMIGTNTIAHSTDNALTWTVSSHTVDGGGIYGVRDIVYGPSGWIAGSAGEGGTTGFLIVSEDGYTWTYPNSNYKDLFKESVYGVLYANGYYVAQGGTQIASAKDTLYYSVSFVGIATATFTPTGIASNQGTLAYQWYQEGVGALSDDDTKIVGAATTTLTVSNLITPDDNGNAYHVKVDYVPTYVGLGTGYQTGNAINEPIQSETAIIILTSLIEIIAQPSSVDTTVNTSRTLTVNATLSDNSVEDDLTYQWYILDSDGNPQIITGNQVSTTTVSSTTTTAGTTTTVRTPFSRSYSSPGTHTIPTTAENITFTLAGARGGNGGNANQGSGGGGGGGRGGSFGVPTAYRGSTFGFYIGSRGSGGAGGRHDHPGGAGGDGHPGGGTGGKSGTDNSGRANSAAGSGAGGGGGGASTLLVNNGRFVIAAGGGGGGGGTYLTPAPGGSIGSPWFGPPVDNKGGGTGDQGSGWEGAGGGGGGGGGANKPGPYITRGYGDGGQAGSSSFPPYQATSGIGGEGGASAYVQFPAGAGSNTGFTLNRSWGNGGDGSGSLSYTNVTTQTSAPEVVVTYTDVTNTIKCSGFNTKTLTLEADYQTVRNFLCRVSSATASNAAVDSEIAAFSVLPVLGENQIVVESITNTDSAEIENINLNNGEYLFESPDSTTLPDTLYSFYAPNNDIEVEMDLYGGKGDTPTIDYGTHVVQGSTGGEGGYSRIRFTMEQNVEYVIAGLTNDIQSPFLYKKGVLTAVVGGGGDGETNNQGGSGGNGGGVGIGGGDAHGHNGKFGIGGSVISAGALTGNGTFGSSYDIKLFGVTLQAGDSAESNGYYLQLAPPFDRSIVGGRTISCAKGVYWAQQGKGACEDLGNVKFRLGNGTVVTNTSDTITRGFKAGYNIMQTAGAGADHRHIVTWRGAYGGNGATGGNGGTFSVAGGGGSGYQDGSVTVVSTMQGGSTGNAKVVLRVAT